MPLRVPRPIAVLLVLVCAAALQERRIEPKSAPLAKPNDNRRTAGELNGTVLDIRLVARSARWRPELERGPEALVYAFAEEGREPQIPGPLIRVPAGTEVRLSLRNALPEALRIYGVQDRPAESLDSVVVPPGETRQFTMRAGAPGTYLYWGRTTVDTFAIGQFVDGQLAGAIVVDSAGPAGRSAKDRIFVIGLWQKREKPPGTPVFQREETLVFNGLAWPATERQRHTVGDTIRWRVVNATRRVHPMHLHGFFFRVDARGTPLRDTSYTGAQRRLGVTEQLRCSCCPGAQRRLGVTEQLRPGTSMAITWSPHTSGNWLFHCHLVEHISGRMDPAARRAAKPGSHENHALRQMSGLVLGITVRPRRGASLTRREPSWRALRLLVTETPRVLGDSSAFSFVLQEGEREPAADSLRVPGSTLVLERGLPVAITVVNRARVPTAVHWHGMELESYFDGVGGWSGQPGGMVAPSIDPGDSFVVRLTPPRSGTFIYHTHHAEVQQLGSGLYGALLVVEPGQQRDSTTDRLLILSTHGLEATSPPSLNGKVTPEPIELRAGTTYRLRFIAIAPSEFKAVQLLANGAVQRWRAVGKDGGELPAHQATLRPARVAMGTGETFDFEYTPGAAGDQTLEIVTSGRGQAPRTMRVLVRVR